MIVINVLIFLIILTSQCVLSKVININTFNGTNSSECCVYGACACFSLYTALVNITSNTTINIISKSVALNNTTRMGSGKLTNITITGNNVTIMCNNSGSVYCESCDNVNIEGITWDSCGDPNAAHAGVTFNGTSNFLLVACIFQHSKISAVSLLEVSDDILIQSCVFMSNYNALSITRDSRLSTISSIITVTINESCFYSNGFFQNVNDGFSRTLYIAINDILIVNCYISFEKTKFISNTNTAYVLVNISKTVDILLEEILVFNSSHLFGVAGSGFYYF